MARNEADRAARPERLRRLRERMAKEGVDGYFDEWRATIDDPEKLARFVSFVNAPDVPDPTISFREERGQIAPAAVDLGATIPVGAPR